MHPWWGSRCQSSSCDTCCNVCRRNLTSAASPRVHISSTCKVGQKLGEILYLLICSFLPCVSWLLRSRVRKSRRDLCITLYTQTVLYSYYVILMGRGKISFIQYIIFPISNFKKGSMMAHRAETCSRERTVKTILVCFNTCTYSVTTTRL